MHKSDNRLSEGLQESSDMSSAHEDAVFDFVDGVFAVEVREEAEEEFGGCGVFVLDHGGDVFVFAPRCTCGFDDQAV